MTSDGRTARGGVKGPELALREARPWRRRAGARRDAWAQNLDQAGGTTGRFIGRGSPRPGSTRPCSLRQWPGSSRCWPGHSEKRTTPAGGESGGRHLDATRGGGAGSRLHGRERSVTSMVYPMAAEGKLARDW